MDRHFFRNLVVLAIRGNSYCYLDTVMTTLKEYLIGFPVVEGLDGGTPTGASPETASPLHQSPERELQRATHLGFNQLEAEAARLAQTNPEKANGMRLAGFIMAHAIADRRWMAQYQSKMDGTLR
jgi:hypothetical protein